ncbi:MAG TPA: methyltransferase domain-containing protein [Candidatus Dormibacteraeota bacterium]|nr:methyltransferase domain-containing protein [Candidatus Dormibacteraeota bacterium]
MTEPSIPKAAVTFDEGAPGYEVTVGRALLPVAAQVVRNAALQPGERVLDVGTGTGNTLVEAAGEGRTLVGLDAAPAMLAIAKQRLPDAELIQGDFGAMPFPDGMFDVIVSSHALLFADDRVAVLREMRRVARAGGRLSLSVPGPGEATFGSIFASIWERYGIATTVGDYPTAAELAGWAESAGWAEVNTSADPSIAVHLPDEAAFRTWRSLGSRGAATRDWTPEQQEALTQEMLTSTPREPDGSIRLPFGALYLTARAPES